MRGVIQLLLIGLVVGCASASGEVHGGETRFDAAAPDPLVVPITEDPFTDASPTSWKGIYRDFRPSRQGQLRGQRRLPRRRWQAWLEGLELRVW